MGEQLKIPTEVSVNREVDGIEMGVLRDGTPYLSSRGLARVCGVAPGGLITNIKKWEEGDRSTRYARFLQSTGFDDPLLQIPSAEGNFHAHPERVVILTLEYYAFVSREANTQAQAAFRALARAGFRYFVYNALGYVPPSTKVPEVWRKYHDRLLLNSNPLGFFSVFKESAEFVLSAIREGLGVDDHTVPDISIGQVWAAHWKSKGLDAKYGERKMHPHNYPDYFPQAAANPNAWVYPVAALGEFRTWLLQFYVPQKFPAYIRGKAAKGALPASTAELLIEAVTPPELRQLPAPADD